MILILNLEVHRYDLPLCSQDSSDHHSSIIFRWQTPKIVCNINTHLALKGLKNFLCDSSRQISLVKIFPQSTDNKLAAGIFPSGSLSRQYDWLTKITWHIAHAIPRVGEKYFFTTIAANLAI